MKVIPEFPPQSPMEVPVHVAAPAPVMSMKSTLDKETAAALIVREVPATLD